MVVSVKRGRLRRGVDAQVADVRANDPELLAVAAGLIAMLRSVADALDAGGSPVESALWLQHRQGLAKLIDLAEERRRERDAASATSLEAMLAQMAEAERSAQG